MKKYIGLLLSIFFEDIKHEPNYFYNIVVISHLYGAQYFKKNNAFVYDELGVIKETLFDKKIKMIEVQDNVEAFRKNLIITVA